MIQTATNRYFIPIGVYICLFITEQEKEAKAQEEERKETRHAQMLAALQRSPMANPEFLKDKA